MHVLRRSCGEDRPRSFRRNYREDLSFLFRIIAVNISFFTKEVYPDTTFVWIRFSSLKTRVEDKGGSSSLVTVLLDKPGKEESIPRSKVLLFILVTLLC